MKKVFCRIHFRFPTVDYTAIAARAPQCLTDISCFVGGRYAHPLNPPQNVYGTIPSVEFKWNFTNYLNVC